MPLQKTSRRWACGRRKKILLRAQGRRRLDACGAGGGEETGEGGGGDDPDGGPSQQVPRIAELHGPAEQAVQEIRE